MGKRESSVKDIELKNGRAKVKFDPFNERIWILDVKGETNDLLDKLKPYYESYPIGKVICTVRDQERYQFEDIGFIKEAEIAGLFNGEKAYFLARYPLESRQESGYIEKENEVLTIAQNFQAKDSVKSFSEDYSIYTPGEEDVEEMAHLYRTIFKTYPTPLEDPNYIKKMMKSDVLFKIVRHNGKVISAASADMDSKYLNAEITDCATYPEYRGKGLITKLMDHLEEELIEMRYKTIYTIARAGVVGINRAFAKRGYIYTGRLINNCHIDGRFEDMNIWVKQALS